MNLLCSGMVGFGLRRNLGTTEKEHPSPTLPPPKVGEVLLFYFSQTASRWFLSLSLMKSASTSPTIGGGRGGEGCSFSAVPKFRRRPKPTIPLHSKFINDQLCFWHHTFSTNSSSTISSSILSTTRRGELYKLIWLFDLSQSLGLHDWDGRDMMGFCLLMCEIFSHPCQHLNISYLKG